MAEATDAVREPRYWKITVNPDECPTGAWELFRTTGRALLGLLGEHGETNYAVRNMKRLAVGDWLVAYTPQEGSYRVGGVGRVTRAYWCEMGPFDAPWNGKVRRCVGVEWQAGACSIADLVKEGRFRKGKIPRVLDEITADEFACVRDRVLAPPAGADAETEASSAAQADGWAATDRLLADLIVGVSEPRVTISETVTTAAEGGPRPSPMVLDPAQEQPPLPQFFLDWAREDKLLGPDLPAGTTLERLSEPEDRPGSRPARAGDLEWSRAIAEAGAVVLGSRNEQMLDGFGSAGGEEGVLDFGLPPLGDADLVEASLSAPGKAGKPSEVRVGTDGWTGLFRREVELGRPCCLLLRGPQYSFLNMTPAGTPLRGLPLFALFAIGAVSAPGKEAYRGGARFIFRGRRDSGDYEVEVRPRRVRPNFREPVELAN